MIDMQKTTRVYPFLLIVILFILACNSLSLPADKPTKSVGRPTNSDGQATNSVGQPTNSNPGSNLTTFTLLGQLGGSAYAVARQGDHVFLGQGPRMVVLDVSKPESPQLVGQSQVMPGSKSLVAGIVRGIQVSGQYAYLATSTGGLHVLDISQPVEPKLVSSVYPEASGCVAVALQDDTAYLACNPGGLFIVDINNPQQLVVLSSGRFTGAASSIAVSGNYVYMAGYASGQSGLLVIDVSKPADPTQIGFFSVNDVPGQLPVYAFWTVRACGSYICLTADSAGVLVLNVSNPANPKVETSFLAGTLMAGGLTVDGERMYVIDDMQGLYVLDITDPLHPEQIGEMPTGVGGFEFSLMEGRERGMLLTADRLWITDPTRGLVVVDVSDPSSPQRIGHYQTPVPNWLMDIAVQGNHAYIVGRDSGFRVVDITDPNNLRELSYNDQRYPDVTGLSPSAIQVRDNYAYVSDLNFPFRVYDISDPSQPKVASEVYDFAASDGAYDLELVGNTAYLTGWGLKDAFYPGEGLWLIDITDPTNAQAVNFIDIPNTNSLMDAEGNILYVLDGSQHTDHSDTLSLRIFDLQDERNPVELAVMPVSDQNTLSYEDILVKDQTLFIGSSQLGLDILDVRDPAHPSLLSKIPGALISKSALEGSTLFMHDLMAYDVSNPQNPVMKGYTFAYTGVQAIAVVDDILYVVTMNNGLFIFEYKR
jgi:hypothetical protein